MNGFSIEIEELIAALEELLDTSNVALILSGTGKLEFIWPRFLSQIVSNNCMN